MAAFVPVILWIISAMICHYIARVRNVKPNLTRRFIVLFIGPFAIPLAFFVKPDKTTDTS